jgi:hypothetical protein
MKVVGFISSSEYTTISSGDNGRTSSTFDYTQWNDSRQYNVSKFTNSLQKEMGTGNIADLMAYNEISKLQVAAEMPGAKLVGMQDAVSEKRRLEQLKMEALQPSKHLGPFSNLRYQIVPTGAVKTYDSNGNEKLQNMYRLKVEYGYRLIDKKPAYHQKMHDLALDLTENAQNKRMHLGNLERKWFNDRIYADDLQIELLSPYRWGASYDYRKIDFGNNSVKYKKGFGTKLLTGLLGIPGGLVLGPRISIVSTKPMTERRVEDLMAILKGIESVQTTENN